MKWLKLLLIVLCFGALALLARASTFYLTGPTPGAIKISNEFPQQFILNSQDQITSAQRGYGGTVPVGYTLQANIATSTTPQDEYLTYLQYLENNDYAITHQEFNPQNDDPTGEIFATSKDYSIDVIIYANESFPNSQYKTLRVDVNPTLFYFFSHYVL